MKSGVKQFVELRLLIRSMPDIFSLVSFVPSHPFFYRIQGHIQRLHELVDYNRLREIVKESCLPAFLNIAWHGICAHGNYRDSRCFRVSMQDFLSLNTVDTGQIDVRFFQDV